MSSEVAPFYAFTLEASRHPVTGEIDYGIMQARSLMIARDAGIQNVWSNVKHTIARAKRFKEPFRSRAIEMAMADLEGIVSIASEGGAYSREFNTSRSTVPIGQMTGQPVSEMDMYMYENVMGEKGKFKNNPKEKGPWLKL